MVLGAVVVVGIVVVGVDVGAVSDAPSDTPHANTTESAPIFNTRTAPTPWGAPWVLAVIFVIPARCPIATSPAPSCGGCTSRLRASTEIR